MPDLLNKTMTWVTCCQTISNRSQGCQMTWSATDGSSGTFPKRAPGGNHHSAGARHTFTTGPASRHESIQVGGDQTDCS